MNKWALKDTVQIKSHCSELNTLFLIFSLTNRFFVISQICTSYVVRFTYGTRWRRSLEKDKYSSTINSHAFRTVTTLSLSLSLSISTKGWINLSGTCSTYTWSIINPSGPAWPCPWVPGATRQQYIHNEATDRYNTPALRSVLCVRVIKPSALPRHASQQPARRGVRDAYRWNVLQVFAAGHHRGQIPCWPLHASKDYRLWC